MIAYSGPTSACIVMFFVELEIFYLIRISVNQVLGLCHYWKTLLLIQLVAFMQARNCFIVFTVNEEENTVFA